LKTIPLRQKNIACGQW